MSARDARREEPGTPNGFVQSVGFSVLRWWVGGVQLAVCWAVSSQANDRRLTASATFGVRGVRGGVPVRRVAKPKRWVTILVPTVVRENGFRIVLYLPSREHGPPHVHVFKGTDAELIVWLGTSASPPHVGESLGMASNDIRRAFRLVESHQTRLLDLWRQFHG